MVPLEIFQVSVCKFAEFGCDNPLLLLKETGGTYRHLPWQNLWVACSDSGGMCTQRPASIVKGRILDYFVAVYRKTFCLGTSCRLLMQA